MIESIEQVNKCYKAVRVDKNKWVSAIIKGDFQLIYRLGEKTVSEECPIFVFSKLSDALDLFGNLTILECECGSVTPISQALAPFQCCLFKEFWAKDYSKAESATRYYVRVNEGTMVTPWVKPIRKVNNG